jgi:polyphosphate glucokinase
MLSPEDKVLALDIGGSHVKATILDAQGNMLTDYKRIDTPVPATPESLLTAIKEVTKSMEGYTKISAGFPGLIKNGMVYTAPNLDNRAWQFINFAQQLEDNLGHPAIVVNDADMQGLGVVIGKGLEMTITLGTGFGTAFFLNGKLLPHFEIAHHPIAKEQTYDEYIGEKAYDKIGKKKWNKRMQKVLAVLLTTFNYDMLYIGGGNSENLTGKLPQKVKIVTNRDGIKGGAKLWEDNIIAG